MNYFAAYRLEVRAMESGKFYSQIIDADTGMEEWESREYEDMEDAYEAGKTQWEVLVEKAQDMFHRRRENAQ